jgi:hypothetical protein
MTHAFFNFVGTSSAARSLLDMVAGELGDRLSNGVSDTNGPA